MGMKPLRAPTYFLWLLHKLLTSFQASPFMDCCLELVAMRGYAPESGEGLIANWEVVVVVVWRWSHRTCKNKQRCTDSTGLKSEVSPTHCQPTPLEHRSPGKAAEPLFWF